MKKTISIILITILCLFSFCGCSVFEFWEKFERIEECKDYNVGPATITEDISKIELNWPSGKVTVKIGDSLAVEETGAEKLSDEVKCAWTVENSTLKVVFSKYELSSFISLSKDLIITVPRGVELQSIEISAASADIEMEGLSVTEYDIQTASGMINLKLDSAKNVEIQSSSGDVILNAKTVGECEIQSSSGVVDATVTDKIDNCDIETASGEVFLKLP